MAGARVSGDRSGGTLRAGASAKLFFALTAILAAIVIVSVFTSGIQRGMDHVMSYGPESEQNAMAIAISELYHGLNSYVGYTSVREILQNAMGPEGPRDPRLLANVRDGNLINKAIAAAIAAPPRVPAHVADGSLMTMVYDDVGIVDYIKIAFTVFGPTIQSLYYLFFAILSLSTAAFFIQFRAQAVAQVVLLAVLSAFALELQTNFFSNDVPTFWGMRHCSTLALVPLWHLAFLMLYRVRLSWWSVGFAALQVAIVLLAIKTRGSTLWVVLFLVGLAAFIALRAWWRLPASDRSIRRLLRMAAVWPLILMLAGAGADKVYTDARLHPVYFTDDVMPYHGAWHSAFLGFSAVPSFPGVDIAGVQSWDRFGYEAALSYLKAKGFITTEKEYVSPWTKTYKMRLHDRVMRSVYLELMRENPLSALTLYAYWKPRQLLIALGVILDGVSLMAWLAVVIGPLALAVLTIRTFRIDTMEVWSVLFMMLSAIAFAALPTLWAYAALHAVADIVLGYFAFVLVAIWAVGVTLFGRLGFGLRSD